MAAMSMEIILFFSKKKTSLFFQICFFFVDFLPDFITEKSHNTISVFEDGSIKQILRAKVWVYGFKIVFWQNLIDFLFVVYLLFFLYPLKN